MGTTIKVLSLNMWGVPFASKKIKQRSEHLIEHLMVSDYQIVGLQEVFTSWHAKLIQDGVKVTTLTQLHTLFVGSVFCFWLPQWLFLFFCAL